MIAPTCIVCGDPMEYVQLSPIGNARGWLHTGPNTSIVEVILNDKVVGRVTVIHGADAQPIQLAASAHAAVSDDATFVVAGKTFTAKDINEWWA